MSLLPGSRILVKITKLERERGLLIAGHRFEMCRDPGIAPWDIALSDGQGRPITVRLAPFSLKDACIFFSFFGGHETLSLLMEQDDSNAATLSSPDTEDALIRLKAHDLEAYYKNHGLETGDYLDFELADSTGSRFKVRPLKASSIPEGRRKAWFAAVAEGVQCATRALGQPVPPSAFIAAAFSASDVSVRTEPAAAFSEYFNEGGALQIKEFMGRAFMWTSEADIPALVMATANRGYAPGDAADDLTRSLGELGIAFDSAEIASFVRDALWHGKGVDFALGRCFAGVSELGLPRKKLDALLRKARAFAQDLATSWDRSGENAELAELRSCLLDIYAAFLDWMRRIGPFVSSPADLDTDEFSSLSEVMQGICDSVALIDSDSVGLDAGMNPIADLSAELVGLRGVASSLMRSIEEKLKGGLAPPGGATPGKKAGRRTKATSVRSARGKGRARPAAEKLYLFEARISYIEPPIRRRVAVPGNRTLGDLHAILQDAFGWTDSHLHLFRFRGDVYGKPSPEDFEPVLDERKIRLDELSLRARSRIEYIYDYGDSWEHELVVAETRKAIPGAGDKPFCLEAERSAPPEDSGGPPGYEDLLEALATPADERDEDEAGFVEWIGGDWDPERCDIAAINTALEKD